MTDLAATDLTYSGFGKDKSTFLGPNKGWLRRGTISFGDGALTYPSGGIPLTKAKLGCPHALVDVIFIETSTNPGNHYEFDRSAGKIRIFENAPSGTISAGTFTGDAPYTASDYVVVDDDSPSGTALFVVLGPGGPGLASNADVAQADTTLVIGDDAFGVKYDANPAANAGVALYLHNDPANTAATDRILVVSPSDANIFIPGSGGGLLKLVDDDNAASNGDAIVYDDDSDARLECTTTGDANANISTITSSWVIGAPTGNVSARTFTGTDAMAAELDAASDAPAATVLEVEVIGW
jgi:hypothetical protein